VLRGSEQSCVEAQKRGHIVRECGTQVLWEVGGGERGKGLCSVVCIVGEYSIFWGDSVEWVGG